MCESVQPRELLGSTALVVTGIPDKVLRQKRSCIHSSMKAIARGAFAAETYRYAYNVTTIRMGLTCLANYLQ